MTGGASSSDFPRKAIWKVKAPTKVALFVWTATPAKTLTMDFREEKKGEESNSFDSIFRLEQWGTSNTSNPARKLHMPPQHQLLALHLTIGGFTAGRIKRMFKKKAIGFIH